MKRNRLLTVTAVVAFFGVAVSNAALLSFDVDPSQTWAGYINAFELDGTTFATGFGETTPATASANWAAGPSTPLTMSPNTRLYDTFWDGSTSSDLFWVNTDGTANKVVEYAYYQEVTGAIGDSVTFDFGAISYDLPVGYEAFGFIKVLDGFASWATTQSTFGDLSTPGAQSLSLTVADAGAGSEIVQAGFYVKGVAVSSTDPIALTGVDVVPEPATAGLMALFGGAIILFRRYSHKTRLR